MHYKSESSSHGSCLPFYNLATDSSSHARSNVKLFFRSGLQVTFGIGAAVVCFITVPLKHSKISSRQQHYVVSMTSWVRTISSPFRKACTFFYQQSPRDDKSKQRIGHEKRVMDLQVEVMACAYEDVRVMWSILDKSKSGSNLQC
ncbi:uncharacterized protein LOC113764487 isoform X2 [Coffea eugenioides]|uniref:uncharacterized protein LOC113764487 isoform X2 n=1 Tax=Coffea eugenioides TaxID=49369 RepID=UPI000F60CB14|nr:uncharacterized protein LOC113764487 isoform X2 [Coffea eugenioides]